MNRFQSSVLTIAVLLAGCSAPPPVTPPVVDESSGEAALCSRDASRTRPGPSCIITAVYCPLAVQLSSTSCGLGQGSTRPTISLVPLL